MPDSSQEGHELSRRTFLVRAGGTGLTLASSGLLAACGGVKESGGGGGEGTIKIGLVTPRTGQAAGFGEVDPYILDLVKDATKDGIKGGDGKTYDIEIITRDSQSSPQRAAEVANDTGCSMTDSSARQPPVCSAVACAKKRQIASVASGPRGSV